MHPYDLTSYFAGVVGVDDVLFVHVASRRLRLDGLQAKVGVLPSQTLNCRVTVNDAVQSGYTLTIESSGTITANWPEPLIIEQGDRLRIVSNDGNETAGHILIAIDGEEFSDNSPDERYDLSVYVPGRIQFNQHLMMALLPRDCAIEGGIVTAGKLPIVTPISFAITVDGNTIGALTFEATKSTIRLFDGPVQLQRGQVLRISAPEREKSGHVDVQLADVSISIIGRV